VKSRNRRLRKKTGKVKGQDIEGRYGELKSRDRRLRKSTDVKFKGPEIEGKDG
jgi:hypothetical protein